jgi:hypothetical protein
MEVRYNIINPLHLSKQIQVPTNQPHPKRRQRPVSAGYRIPDVHIAASRLDNCAGLCPVHRLESFVNVFLIIPSNYDTGSLTNLHLNDQICRLCTLLQLRICRPYRILFWFQLPALNLYGRGKSESTVHVEALNFLSTRVALLSIITILMKSSRNNVHSAT